MENEEVNRWLYIEEQVIVDDKLFFEGVTWRDFSVNEDGSYTIHSDISGEVRDYIIPKKNALITDRKRYETNLPYSEWKYRQSLPPIIDYEKAAKDYLGITFTSAPTYRDGDNPHIRRENSKDQDMD